MAEKFSSGFVRDSQGRLVVSEGGPEGWISGFVRDQEGRLVVVGPGGRAVGEVPGDGTVTLAKLATTATAALERPYRTRKEFAGTIEATATENTKYFILNGQANAKEINPYISQPFLINWVPADEAVEGLTTKCRIKATCEVAGSAVNRKVKVALFTLTRAGGKVTLNEEVAGTSFELEPGAGTNTDVAGESGKFTLAEGKYSVGAVVLGGAPGANFGINGRFVVNNEE